MSKFPDNDVSNLFKQVAVIVAINPRYWEARAEWCRPSLAVAQLRGAFGDNDMKVIRAFENAIKILPEIQALYIKGMTECLDEADDCEDAGCPQHGIEAMPDRWAED